MVYETYWVIYRIPYTHRHNLGWHFGIARTWALTLDLEMLDSGPRFPEISVKVDGWTDWTTGRLDKLDN